LRTSFWIYASFYLIFLFVVFDKERVYGLYGVGVESEVDLVGEKRVGSNDRDAAGGEESKPEGGAERKNANPLAGNGGG
jgi:hypothetical protein